LCKPEKTKLSGEILVAEYLGSDQFVYIDCGFENMLTVRVDPSKDWQTNNKVGLKFDSEALHLFNSDGNRVE
jgi:multiple sugar transport system ATP-binding protein